MALVELDRLRECEIMSGLAQRNGLTRKILSDCKVQSFELKRRNRLFPDWRACQQQKGEFFAMSRKKKESRRSAVEAFARK